MFVFSSPFRAPLIRLSVSLPVLGLALIVTPLLHAGNQSGPGWQQVEPKAKSNASPKTKPKLSANRPQKIKPPKELVGPSAFPINPQRSAPAAEDLLRDIPGNTLLREDDLVLLAIANNPELARRRSEILIARAKVKGAGDWDNPELRIGYAWDDDERLREPSVSRETEQINTSERYAQTQNQQNLAGPLEVGAGESQYQRSVGSIRTSRYRTIERSVTPGRYRDVIETKTYESRNASESNNKTTVKTKQGANFTTLEAGGQNTDRRLVERSRATIDHPDNYSRNDKLGLMVRFRVPNPWERRAKIELAAAETERAESDYLIAEDKVVRSVRAIYEDLNTTESLSRSAVERREINEKFSLEIEAANQPGLADLAADIRLGIGKSMRDHRELRSDISRYRQELATYCGLEHPERIGIIGKPTRRVVPLESLDTDYLLSIAQLNRSDLLDLQARLSVAKAELKVSRSAKIPFFTFVDGGWGTTTTTGRSGESEEWSVRAGISLPLFDWFGLNKAYLEHQTATEAYSRQIEEQRHLITTEIRAALDRIRASAKELSLYEKDLARVKSDARKSIEQTSIDPIRSLKTRYQTEELVYKFEADRYEIWSDYYKAVMELERALGTRLERVLIR